MTPYDKLTDYDLDRLVAERVLGWNPSFRILLFFSSSHNVFFAHVIPAMRSKGFTWQCEDEGDAESTVNFHFWKTKDKYNDKYFAPAYWYEIDDYQLQFLDYGDKVDKSLPRAGCIAALLALDAIEGETK
jgi:hypothetical protein